MKLPSIAPYVMAAAVALHTPAQAEGPPQYDAMGKVIRPPALIDYSTGTLGALGPFYWARALDLGEHARFADETGFPDRSGRFLWAIGYGRVRADERIPHGLHPRNNFLSRDPTLGWQVQPWRVLIHSDGGHNSKIDFGYAAADYRFLNGDNEDFAHFMGCDRVGVFMPVRRDKGSDAYDPAAPFISPIYGAQSFCVIEFRKDEIISYDWFHGGEGKLDPHILFDLAPFIRDANLVKPNVTKPISQFDIHGDGRWTFRFEPDGRDGLKGGSNVDDWDFVFTEKSPGAKPYTVPLTPQNSRWALTVYTPNGSPIDASEILIGLDPYERASGKPAAWTDRKVRVTDVPAAAIDKEIEKARAESASRRDRPE